MQEFAVGKNHINGSENLFQQNLNYRINFVPISMHFEAFYCTIMHIQIIITIKTID